MLECTALGKRYGDKQALADVDLQVRPGEIVALLGKNGAGKTTIMNCIAGIITPTSGSITFEGRSLLPESADRARFGILITAVFFDYLNVEDNLRLLMRSSGTDAATIPRRIGDILELVGLADQRRRKVRSFSFGMKQRLGLAQALAGEGDFLMLDEPLVGLDPPGKELFKSALVRAAKEQQKAVLFSSHDLADVADVCDRIVMIREGRVVYDGAYHRDHRFAIRTRAPLNLPAGAPATVHGRTALLEEAGSLNDLIALDCFRDNPIEDIAVNSDALMELFRD